MPKIGYKRSLNCSNGLLLGVMTAVQEQVFRKKKKKHNMCAFSLPGRSCITEKKEEGVCWGHKYAASRS